jgi:acid phosphatase
MLALSVFMFLIACRGQTTSPSIKNVFVIVMESYGWADIHNNASAPYINSLLGKASYATQYYPAANIKLSLPEYIWMEAGDNLGVTNDNSPSKNEQTTKDHLVTYLNNAGVSWKGYFEDIPGTTCPTKDVGHYAVRHDPLVYFTDVTSDPAYCISHIRPFSELAVDLASGSAAQYNFIKPNTCNDMHDDCGGGDIANGDTWLKNNLPLILNSQVYKNGGAVFLTWDNDDSSIDNPVPMIVLSPAAKGGGYNNDVHYTHGSLVRTIEEIFGVKPLLRNAASVEDLSDLFSGPIVGTYAPGR